MKTKIKYLAYWNFRSFVAILATGSIVHGQNLAPNESFEEVDSIGCSYISDKEEFSAILQDWYMPTRGTPDVYNIDAIDTSCPLHPLSIAGISFGNQIPYHGTKMLGMISFTEADAGICPDYKEYIQVRLKMSLEPDHRYYVGYYFSLSDSSKYATPPPEILFSVDPILSDTCLIIEGSTHIRFTDLATNTSTWTRMDGVFKADGAFRFMTIGSFHIDDNIPSQVVHNPDNGLFNLSYHYVDSVFVEKIDELHPPSIITPNGDGLNDKFVVANLSGARWVLKVVNRYGKEVFQSKYYDNEWDGGGLPTGVYFYSIQFRFVKEIIYKGHLTIMN